MIIIIGGGITGLAAAYELAARGVPFLLLEASDRTGGLIQTHHTGGFTIEAGPDSMLAQKPAALRLCEELGLGARLMSSSPPRTAYVLARGGLYPLPSPSILGIPTTWSGIAGYRLLSPRARARLAIEPIVPRASQDAGDESVASFFSRRFGKETVRLIAAPLLGGIHAGDVEALSIHSLFPRLVEAEVRSGSVLRAFRRHRSLADGAGLFRSLAAGMGELVSALERRLPAGSVRLSSAVAALGRAGDRWQVRWTDGSATADTVILATPAYVAGRLLTPIDETAAELCNQVPYVSTATVALAWSRARIPHPLAGSGFVVARRHSALRITACTWVSSKWKGRAPPGAALMRAFIGGAADPGAASLPDDVLIEIVTRELSSVLGMTTPPELARVYRWIRAGAQHNVGQLARVARIETRLAALPGLMVAGSGFRSIGIPDCIADGRAAAAAAHAFLRGS